MKEITRVHLAKTPYDIEIDAKKALEKYLSDIEKAMKTDDVMVEIEARMVELLAERGVSAGGVISLEDVQSLKEQMGAPGEFSEDGEAVSETPAATGRKRLMRDTDNALLGGVCSGLAAYFGIDVVWSRILAAILLVVSFGAGVLLYLLLWIIIPSAKTAADKLQMRGEPVTLDSLRNFSSSESTVVVKSQFANTIKKILGVSAGVILLLMMAGGILALVFGTWFGWSAVSLLDGLTAQPYAWGLLGSLIIGGMAFVMLCGFLANICFTRRANRIVTVSAVVALMIGTLSASMVGIFGAQTAANLSQDMQRLSKVVKLELPDMNGVKSILPGSDNYDLMQFYSDEPVRAELHYYDLTGVKPEVKIERRGDEVYIKVNEFDNKNCSAGAGWLLGVRNGSICHVLGRAQVMVYGGDYDREANRLELE